MAICTKCAEAASGTDGLGGTPIPTCSICGQGPMCVYRTDVPLEEQRVVRHKRRVAINVKIWCEGSLHPPKETTGHDFCNGCPCQHRPPGSWKGGD